jgi:hypothetical protein
MERRFFVTVIAPDRKSLVQLSRYDFDLFRQTAQLTSTRAVTLRATGAASEIASYQESGQVEESNEFVIDGLLYLEEVGKLVDDGYQVLVKQNAAEQSRGNTEVVEFSDWLKGMEEE